MNSGPQIQFCHRDCHRAKPASSTFPVGRFAESLPRARCGVELVFPYI